MAPLTLLLLPDDAGENVRTLIVTFPVMEQSVVRNDIFFPEFGLPCYSGSFLDEAHLMPSFPADEDSLLYTIVLCHPDLIYINNAFLKGFWLLVLWR